MSETPAPYPAGPRPLTPEDEAVHAFADRVGQLLAGGGLPPLAGRLWGWLLVCDPPQQSAAALAQALEASRGSISGMARLLESAGLVRRLRRRGDRREYFVVEPGSISAVLESRLPVTRLWRLTAEEGLRILADKPPPVRARLQELHDVYAFMERELPALLERYQATRKARPEASHDDARGRGDRTA